MQLLTGPPASGKSSYCLGRIRTALRTGAADCRLLTPTTTMAEHLRNELARGGYVFSPKIVSTFGKFVADYVRDLTPVSRPELELIVDAELHRLELPRYSAVRDFPGFRSALVRSVEEFAGAGGLELANLDELTGPEFAAVFRAVRARVAERDEVFRAQRLLTAAQRIAAGPRFGTVCVIGFFAFTSTELEVLRALSEVSDLTVALAETPASRPALRALRAFPGTEEQRLADQEARPARTLFTAPTVEGEATEIARRILEEKRTKRLEFRDIGVIVRSHQPFVPALRTAFERFKIPFRTYFAAPLKSDPTVRFLTGLVDAALAGWDFAASLPVLRMHGSPLEKYGDEFEFRVLERLPDRGLDNLREVAPEFTHAWLESLKPLESWPAEHLTPATWAKRFRTLPLLFRRSEIRDGATQEQMLTWRAQSAALEHFAAAVDETARALGDETGPMSCADFRDALNAAISSAELRVVDRRRDVVHIIDAVEARQWRCRVMFVCGLLESDFPRHHTEDPILPDDVRRKLQRAGVAVRTSVERQEEEQFLFDLALTRATDRLYLSYPLLNAKGEPNLPSLFLERATPYEQSTAVAVKPKPVRARAPEFFPILTDPALRSRISERHAKLSASGIEKFITCPWSFFAQRTLKLHERPAEPWDRLNNLVQGTIAHAVLERVCRDNISADQAFEAAFEATCVKARIPDGYRTEAIRLELQHGIRQLVRDTRLNYRGIDRKFEEAFECNIPDGPKIRGQIDRIEVHPSGKAIILDYKYKRRTRIEANVRENRDGRRVQTGLYLIGARSLGYQPAGMVYLGFKREASAGGWVTGGLWPELESACSPSELEDVVILARQKAVEVWQDILAGRIDPKPYELSDCEWCSFSTICRIEAMPQPAVEVAGRAAE